VAVRLLLIPGICEALVSGGAAIGIFSMNVWLGFSLVGPSIALHRVLCMAPKIGIQRPIMQSKIGSTASNWFQ
jgi:hypothetical protein